MANSEDPDQMLHNSASEQGLHCLQRTRTACIQNQSSYIAPDKRYQVNIFLSFPWNHTMYVASNEYPQYTVFLTVYYSQSCVLQAPNFCTRFCNGKKKKKRCFYVKHGIAILFSALLTEFPGAKACHISLGSKIGELSAGYWSKWAEFTIMLTEFWLWSSVTLGFGELDGGKLLFCNVGSPLPPHCRHDDNELQSSS